MQGQFVIAGRIWDGDHFEDGHAVMEKGSLKEVEFGEIPKDFDAYGCLMPGIADTHTHVADAGLKLGRRYGLEELVAPPDGLKHRYLSETPPERIASDMAAYTSSLISSGVSGFIDFREGGVEGARLLRSVSDRAVILGRPVSPEYDPNEIDAILEYADGIGIPSISDMKASYIDAVADHVRRRNGMLALHVSERIREDIGRVISLSPDLIVHMTQADDSDMRACADAGIPVSVCPTSNLYFGMVPPVARMLDAGMEVSLGTDNAMLFPSADIFSEMRLLSSLLSTQGRDPSDAFACALACGHKVLYHEPLTRVGSGMSGDLLFLPCDESQLLAGNVCRPVRYDQPRWKHGIQEHPGAD